MDSKTLAPAASTNMDAWLHADVSVNEKHSTEEAAPPQRRPIIGAPDRHARPIATRNSLNANFLNGRSRDAHHVYPRTPVYANVRHCPHMMNANAATLPLAPLAALAIEAQLPSNAMARLL